VAVVQVDSKQVLGCQSQQEILTPLQLVLAVLVDQEAQEPEDQMEVIQNLILSSPAVAEAVEYTTLKAENPQH